MNKLKPADQRIVKQVNGQRAVGLWAINGWLDGNVVRLTTETIADLKYLSVEVVRIGREYFPILSMQTDSIVVGEKFVVDSVV